MAILSTLKKLEKSLGRDVIRRELEQVVFEWDAPHWPEACLHCRCHKLKFCLPKSHNFAMRFVT
jgi:hypothetical protein